MKNIKLGVKVDNNTTLYYMTYVYYIQKCFCFIFLNIFKSTMLRLILNQTCILCRNVWLKSFLEKFLNQTFSLPKKPQTSVIIVSQVNDSSDSN